MELRASVSSWTFGSVSSSGGADKARPEKMPTALFHSLHETALGEGQEVSPDLGFSPVWGAQQKLLLICGPRGQGRDDGVRRAKRGKY
jgi:hypothetical protein